MQSLRNTNIRITPDFHTQSKILYTSKPSNLLDSATANCSILNISKSKSGQPSRPPELLFGSFRDDFSTRAEQLRREAMHDTPLSALPISEAGRIWLKEHSRYIKLRTRYDYEQYLKALEKFFTLPLAEIHVGTIRLYQDWRSQFAGAARINMELSTLQQILKEAKLWDEIAKFYRPLPISHRGSGQSITPEDEEKLLDIAFASRRRTLAAHCLRIMLRTGVGFGELRRIRKRDIDLKERLITIWDGAKNESRERTIPLTDQALESINWIVDRWHYLGGEHGDEFILPHCSNRKNGPRDFSRPMGSIKKAFAGIRQEAVTKIGLHMARFRIYDCRTTAVTRSLSSGKVSVHTAEKLFGHSQAMTRRYYKPTMSVLREAVDVLERKKA